jgi:hypothetical protein
MEGANLLNDQFGEVLAGREFLDFVPRDDNHFGSSWNRVGSLARFGGRKYLVS